MSMQNQSGIIPFAFGDNMVRVITGVNGEPWFVAKDMVRALGYPESSLNQLNNLLRHVPEEWTAHNRIMVRSENGTEQERDILTLSEPGLYFFLGRSDKSGALPFQKWLAGEVLPDLRKTGNYTMPGVTLPEQVRLIKPAVRERLLATAQRVLNMSGIGGPEEVEALFLRYCRLVTEGYSENGVACTTSSSSVIDPVMVEKIMKFIDICCEPVTQNRLRASKIYTAFCRWWQKEYDEPAPTTHAFGRIFGRRYRRDKRGGQVYYLDVRLAQ